LIGERPTLDLEVAHKDHNFYAEGVVVSNSHSSCYAKVTAYTLYLKANHPLQFYLALLNMARHEANSHTVIAEIEKEMRSQGYHLLPPSFMQPHPNVFSIEGTDSIRFALNLIRGVSDKSMEKLQTFLDVTTSSVKENAGQPMSKFAVFQALKGVGLHIGIVSSLVQAGCMAGYESYVDKNGKPFKSRSRLVLELNTWNVLTDTERKHCLSIGGKPEVNWDVIMAIKHLSTMLNEKGKPMIKETRLVTLRKKYQPYAEIYEMNRRNERLANYFYERKVLGYSYSETLSSIFGEKIDGLSTIADVKDMDEGDVCKIIGFVSEPKKGKTRKGNDEFQFTLSDETGQMRFKAFNDKIEVIELNNDRLPIEEDIVICNCKKMGAETLFAERARDGSIVGIQTAKIYMKLSELKDAKAAKEEKEALAAEAAKKEGQVNE
jgi:DNA polymerase-3 subunit alpha